jgi:hypothetical protein
MIRKKLLIISEVLRFATKYGHAEKSTWYRYALSVNSTILRHNSFEEIMATLSDYSSWRHSDMYPTFDALYVLADEDTFSVKDRVQQMFDSLLGESVYLLCPLDCGGFLYRANGRPARGTSSYGFGAQQYVCSDSDCYHQLTALFPG